MCCKTGTFTGTDPVRTGQQKPGLSPETRDVCVDHGGEFMITSGLHKYACDLTLDTNTANKQLILSDENRKATRVNEQQSYSDHPDRFDYYPQVLCVESLTGRCYWETEWSGDYVYISVSYKEIERKGGSDDCLFGYNVNSWSLECSDHTFIAHHNHNDTAISAGSWFSNRVGVYVDVSGGTLSFYSVSDTHKLTHIHTFTHTFTQPLHAGCYLYPNSSLSLCFRKFNIRHTRQFPVSDHQDEDVSPVRDTFCVSGFTDVLNQQQ
ncbi:Stonustoxin subunit alpha [Labeo rohita]|uniref:Stonustoxin subunit alpha n=1 Tax=Labeo rohita TaxID=84645 RepID=A0ABQ8L4V7_LABRO|nr:Stonustoxin subunit alpha [Labeo rohita]